MKEMKEGETKKERKRNEAKGKEELSDDENCYEKARVCRRFTDTQKKIPNRNEWKSVLWKKICSSRRINPSVLRSGLARETRIERGNGGRARGTNRAEGGGREGGARYNVGCR